MKRLASLAAIVMFGLAGCTSSPTVDTSDRDAAIYRLAIIDLFDRSPVEPVGSHELPVLFIEAFDLDAIDLEVQVALIAALIERFEVRFVDRRDEALETDLPGNPVGPGRVFIGLGPVNIGATATVRVERYHSTTRIDAYEYEFTRSGNEWYIVADDPRAVEPQGFVSPS